MILYVLIGLALASFVIAFFSARTWHWGYVLVVEAIVLSTIGFFLLAAETLRINGVLRAEVNRVQKDLDNVVEENVALRDGTSEGLIISRLTNGDPAVKTTKNAAGNETIEPLADLDSQVLISTRLRGHVWRDVAAGQSNPQTGVVNLPALAGLKTQSIVYVFEDPPAAADGTQRGAQYIGDFMVTQAGGQQTTLQPVHQMDQFE